ncbi:MAG: SUMF1/EgtB/PvdO family nonheme iron enzyme [Aestuariivirga sp.]|nr:SUMF1/EgtB/PvdO family nonheme iron enzyme [Aestuariivirga sp.]
MKGNLFAFVAAQVLIAVVAFVVVTDYIADGPIKREVSNILSPAEDTGRNVKSDQDAPIAAKPPAALEEASNQETTATQEIPSDSDPAEYPATEIEKQAATVEPLPKAEEPPTALLDVPTPPESAEIPTAEIQKPVVAVEPAPPAEEPAASLIQPPAAEKAGEDVVALAPIPDLTPQADAPTPAPSADATKPTFADGQMIRDCSECPELAVVNAGRFAMGEGSEGLEYQVSVTATQDVAITAPFAIGRYEITFDEWSQCVGDGGCTRQPGDENWGRGRRPVINVSFNDITQQYLPWLSATTGFSYRLPTEAEWEFAARGGAAAAAGQAYSFGNDGTLLCQYGNSSDNAETVGACSDGFAATAPVGSLKPNGLGLFDMHGNVWEWTADCWQPQYSAKAAKPAETCTTRLLRGGSWASNAAALRSAARGWESQDKSKNSIGFRVARALP